MDKLLRRRYPDWDAETGVGLHYLGLSEDGIGYCLMDQTKAERALGVRAPFNLAAGVSD